MKTNNFFYTLIVILIFFFISAEADEKFNLGKKLFLNNCAACHALLDAQSSGNIGPNLNEIKPAKDQIIHNVTRGIGVMQAFEGILSSEEIEAVAHYVSIASNN